jgi:hypothetical protein
VCVKREKEREREITGGRGLSKIMLEIWNLPCVYIVMAAF